MAFIIKNPPEFTLEVTQWNRDTLADGVEMAKVPEALLNNDVYLKEQIERQQETKTVTLTAAMWSGSGPYTQTVAVEDITGADNPIASLHIPDGATGAEVKAWTKAFGMIDEGVTTNGALTVRCYNKKPGVDVHLVIKGA